MRLLSALLPVLAVALLIASCGHETNSSDIKVIRGSHPNFAKEDLKAPFKAAYSIVRLSTDMGDSSSGHCTGTVINTRPLEVLTAAHCVLGGDGQVRFFMDPDLSQQEEIKSYVGQMPIEWAWDSQPSDGVIAHKDIGQGTLQSSAQQEIHRQKLGQLQASLRTAVQVIGTNRLNSILIRRGEEDFLPEFSSPRTIKLNDGSEFSVEIVVNGDPSVSPLQLEKLVDEYLKRQREARKLEAEIRFLDTLILVGSTAGIKDFVKIRTEIELPEDHPLRAMSTASLGADPDYESDYWVGGFGMTESVDVGGQDLNRVHFSQMLYVAAADNPGEQVYNNEEGKNASYGDSGGPLYRMNVAGEPELAGVVVKVNTTRDWGSYDEGETLPITIAEQGKHVAKIANETSF